MPDVVTLDLETRLVRRAGFENVLNVLECVLENPLVRPGQIRHFPVVLPVFIARQHRIHAEIHRAHVERGDLGLELQRRLQTLVDAHRRRAAGGEVDHDIRAAGDVRGKFAKPLRVLRRPAIDRVARMQMYDGRARLGRTDGCIGNFFGGNRQVRRHGRRMNRAGHGTGDDDFAVLANRHDGLRR